MSEEFAHLEARIDELEWEIARAHIFTCALANLLCKQGVVNADILQSQQERLRDPRMTSNADLQFMQDKVRWDYLDKLVPILQVIEAKDAAAEVDLPDGPSSGSRLTTPDEAMAAAEWLEHALRGIPT